MGLIFYEKRDYFILRDEENDYSNECSAHEGKTNKAPNPRFNQNLCERFLVEKKIGIYDIAKRVIRQQGNASDNFLDIVEPVNLPDLLDQIPDCQVVAATGQKSLETIVSVLKSQNPNLTVPGLDQYQPFENHGRALILYRLPSTSRAYPKPLEKKAQSYQRLIELLTNRFQE